MNKTTPRLERKLSCVTNSQKVTIEKMTITPLWTPEEAAQVLGVTVGTLQVWRCTKRYPLAYVKVGRCVKYRPEDVQAFMETRLVAA